MIDLHCHLLPGIDDGAKDMATSLAMARIAVADGIRVTACTPHIYPGLYENDAAGIRTAMATLSTALAEAGIDLELTEGADAHMVPEVAEGVRRGRIPTLGGSHYLLLEPPHHVAPPHFRDVLFQLRIEGLVPVITHPERLTWVEEYHGMLMDAVDDGCWMQITAGALTGRFGPRPRYWAERFLGEGRAHVLATDAHDDRRRPPLLAEAHAVAERWMGREEADNLVRVRPGAVLADESPDTVAPNLAAGTRSNDRARRPPQLRWDDLRTWLGLGGNGSVK